VLRYTNDNSEIDIYAFAFAIEANDDNATVKSMSNEIREIIKKYKYAPGSENTYKTDIREVGFSVPKMLYGVMGISNVVAVGLRKQDDEHKAKNED